MLSNRSRVVASRPTLALFGLYLLLTTLANSLNLAEAVDDSDDLQAYREWQEFKEFQEFRQWRRAIKQRKAQEMDSDKYEWMNRRTYGLDNEYKFKRKSHGDNRWTRKDVGRNRDDPPPINKAALMARYIVNQADWTSVATISSQKGIESYPFVNIISFSDGPLGNGTGVPYMYLTPLDFTAQDVFKDNRATLMMSLVQGHYCKTKDYDPMDPRCARVVLTGTIKALKEADPEFPTARSAVFGRHPWLAHMPPNHNFFFAKLKMATIAVLDTFGGPKYVTPEDYMHPPSSRAYFDYFSRYTSEE